MTDDRVSASGLRVGDELKCPHCGQWHTVWQPFASDSTAAKDHLHVTCSNGRYYVGAIGGESRWPRRATGAQ